MKIITFLSDYGDTDWFVAAVKGEVLKIARNCQIVDISHKIKRHDIRSAAFMLASVFRNFPAGTVHLAVVDPGVGGTRRPLILGSQGHYFVGPDNGLFSFVLERGARIYAIMPVRRAGSTFHGRDLFGPAAAMLAGGARPEKLGTRIGSCIRLKFPVSEKKGGVVMGEIIYIDGFGNLITNIPNAYGCRELMVRSARIEVKRSYCSVKKNSLVAVKGSSGYYEIACNQGNARQRLKARTGLLVRAVLT